MNVKTQRKAHKPAVKAKPEPETPRSGRAPGLRSQGYVQLGALVHPDTKLEATLKATREGLDMSQVVGELLAGWVNGRFKLK